MLPISANVSATQITPNQNTVNRILKAVPASLWPESFPVDQRSSRNSSMSIDHDFVVIAEFCEVEGPKPTLVFPESHSLLFDLDDYMLRIFSADTSGIQLSVTGSGSLVDRPDCESCIYDRVTLTYAFIHYLTLRDAHARGYVRPFAVLYLTPSEGKLQSQMDRICCILRSAVGDMRRSNVSIFCAQLLSRIQSMQPEGTKYEQICSLYKEFSQYFDKPLKDDAVQKDETNSSPSIGSLWELCGHDTIDHVSDRFNRLLEMLSGTPSALSVTALRGLAVDLTSKDGLSLVFMNRLALLPPLIVDSDCPINANSFQLLGRNSEAEDNVSKTVRLVFIGNEKQTGSVGDSDSALTLVESVSPVVSPQDISVVRQQNFRSSTPSCAEHSDSSAATGLDIEALTLPYFSQSAWQRGVITGLLENNHEAISQALIWLSVGLPLVIAGKDDKRVLFELSNELASLTPSSALFVNEDNPTVCGITVSTPDSSTTNPPDIPANSPSLWVEKASNKTLISAWGPSLKYSPISKLLRRSVRLSLPIPLIRLLLATYWTFLAQLAFLHPGEDDPCLDQTLKHLGLYPADRTFIPSALRHFKWLCSHR